MSQSNAPVPASVQVYRVTVRGQFRDLTDQVRSFLAASAAEHDIFRSAFTEEGTFTYDEHLRFFNLRYEVRLTTGVDDEVPADSAEVAVREAESFLRTLHIGHGPLRAAVMDLSEMAERARRSR